MAKVTFIVLFTLCILWTATRCCATASVVHSNFLKVPPSKFLHSLKLVNHTLKDITSIFQQLQIRSNVKHTRIRSAITTCLELMNLSAEQLRWCVSTVENPEGKYDGTGNIGSDLSTWLGAVLANVDTCIEGFEDTSHKIKGHIIIGLEKVNSLISDLLINQVEIIIEEDHHLTTTHDQSPSWVKHSDEELLVPKEVPFDVVVALDGTGNYTRIMDAVNAAPESSVKRYVIYIKKGEYNEHIVIGPKKENLMMVGDGKNATIISGDLSFGTNLTTYKTATFTVNGRGFMAKYICFRNNAGPGAYQAVALVSDSDCSVFYRCAFVGFQDTLYVHAGRQFYKECTIRGTVDFIFGFGAAVFQDCQVLVRKGLMSQHTNTITAHGRKATIYPYGFTFQFCNISADSELLPFLTSTQTFLGRPWNEYSTTVFMESYLSDVVSPQGWCEWNGTPVYLDTLYYAEYRNYGLGAGVKNRVKWANYHVLNDPKQASKFTTAQLLSENQWLPLTGVPYTPGLGGHNITEGK